MKRRIMSLGAVVLAVYLVLAAVATGRTESRGGLGLSISGKQPGSPLTMLSATHEKGAAYSLITIKNESSRRIDQVSFGALVFDRQNRTARPRYYASLLIGVALEPGATKIVDAQIISKGLVNDLLTNLPSGADAEAGVVLVNFGDGTTWTYDARTNGHFGKIPLAMSGRACSPWKATFATVLSAFSAHYECVESANQEWCDNNNQGQSCTNTLCGAGECPKQKCELKLEG